jgi:hypothetical protein
MVDCAWAMVLGSVSRMARSVAATEIIGTSFERVRDS